MKYFILTDAQFQSDPADFLTQSQRFDEFQRTGSIGCTHYWTSLMLFYSIIFQWFKVLLTS